MMCSKLFTAGVVLALLACLCGSCSYVTAGYDIFLRPVEVGTGTPLNAADVQVQLFRSGEPIGIYEVDGVAYPLAGGDMQTWVTVDAPEIFCLLFFCSAPTPMELGDPPDEARVTVLDGERTGVASLPIAPADIVIEYESYGRINLGTVEITFDTQP